ncbi:Extensin-like protein C-terminus [Roseovarius azorensis]|uniref:Extensin-like protein C-terminus n=1 Tax=Roseovarius azorensis TaxID=1287727 RepID=A0A1H7MIX6_9RHOB|nr:extensin family protein [Roseovarius azorensis]SEL11203.1 Extensin-like protein C-terminus [Roseovarius azorensis]
MMRAVLGAALGLSLVATGCGRGDDPEVTRRGGLCGDPGLAGSVSGYLPGEVAGCGVERAVRLEVVHGVRLSQPATLDCPTARAVGKWVRRSAKPEVRRMGGELTGLRVPAHYVCRARNHQSGARISEHGRGRAIDIAALQLRDGTEISVLEDWGNGQKGRILRRLHGQACGTFGTVLGPESDAHHRDHFHFDTARHRGGPYCR